PDLSLPEQIEPVVMKALEKDRDRRYAVVMDFARAFAAAAQGAGTAESGVARAQAQPAVPSHVPMTSAPSPRPPESLGYAREARSREADVAVQTPPPMTPVTPAPPSSMPSSSTPAEPLAGTEAILARAPESPAAAEASALPQGGPGQTGRRDTE